MKLLLTSYIVKLL